MTDFSLETTVAQAAFLMQLSLSLINTEKHRPRFKSHTVERFCALQFYVNVQ